MQRAAAIATAVVVLAIFISSCAAGPEGSSSQAPSYVSPQQSVSTSSGAVSSASEPPAPDGLVVGPSTCGDGTVAFTVWIPYGWFANPATSSGPACRAISPVPFDPTSTMRLNEVPLQVDVVVGDFSPDGDVVSQADVTLGGTSGLRLVVQQNDVEYLYYVIGLGDQASPTASNQKLVASTQGGQATFDRDSQALDQVVSRLALQAPISEPDSSRAAADALLAETSICESPAIPFSIPYPKSWFTSDESASAAPCTWFAASPVSDKTAAEIQLEIVDGSFGTFGPVFSLESRVVGGLPAQRIELYGGTVEKPDRSQRTLQFIVDLDRSITGRHLIATTSTASADDYELAKAILDRMLTAAQGTHD